MHCWFFIWHWWTWSCGAKIIEKKDSASLGFSRGEGVHAHTSAVLGTSSQKISHLISPTFVCKVTDCKQIQLNPQINILQYTIDHNSSDSNSTNSLLYTHKLLSYSFTWPKIVQCIFTTKKNNKTRNTTLTIMKTPRSTWKLLVLKYKPSTPNVSFFRRQLSLRPRMQTRRKTNE